ncbi:hypothetical protein [Rhodanobacter sp. BL-MT-08]
MNNENEHAAFEKWYVENAFDYEANPIGSRECGLQRKAWQAARAQLIAEQEKVEPLAWLETEPSATIKSLQNEHGLLRHSMQFHVGKAKPVNRPPENKLFPLYTMQPIPAAQDDQGNSVAALARPIESAPRDGRMLQLLVQFDEHATDDTLGPAWTIGSNSFDENGEDNWQFAGWCWDHDHFTEGKGTPVGWAPMIDDRSAPSTDRLAAQGGDELARDAARYRWFASNASLVIKGRGSYLELPVPYTHDGMSVGEYIDAALRATPADGESA